MAFSVQMPALGESVTEGTVTRWLKEEGDTVEADEPLLEVSTDKVDTEIPAPTSGVLTKIVAHEDDVVEIGGELALIGEEGETASSDDSDDSASGSEPEEAGEPEPTPEAPSTDADAPAEKPAAATAPSGSASGTDVLMPELGESVTEGTVTNWLKKVGDEVAEDEPLLEVSTDKVDTEIPSPVAGTLLEIVAEEDDVVEIGGKLAVIGDKSAAAASEPEPEPEPAKEEPAPAKEEAKPEPEPEPAKDEPEPAKASAPAATKESNDPPTVESTPYVTPLVRKLAADNDIDLNSVKGTGVGGRIRKQDVLAAAEAKKAPAAQSAPAASSAPAAAASAPAAHGPEVRPELAELRGTTQKISRIRQITAKKTRESLQQSAQLTQVFEIDMTKVAALRKAAKESFKASEGVNLTYLPFIAKAVVEALKAHPNVNASIDEDKKGDHLLRQGASRHRRRHRAGSVVAGHPQRRRPVSCRSRACHRRHRVPCPLQRPQAGRARRWNVHHHQHRQPGRVVRHPDPRAAASGHARHRRHRQAPCGDHRRRRIGIDRGALDVVLSADLRSPADRRCRRGTLPDHHQEAARRRRVRGRIGAVDTAC